MVSLLRRLDRSLGLRRSGGAYPLGMSEAGGIGESKELLARAALSDPERDVVSRLVGLLEDELAGDLRAIWLYGSRARGEAPTPI